MSFIHPGYLWLLLLGLIPVILYMFRRKSRQVNVSTLVFFKTLAKEHQESAWIRRLKKLLSFLLTMIVLVASIVILARLVMGGGGDDNIRTIVVLLDRSASMAVTDDTGESRMDAAKRLITERLKSVPEEVGVALIVYDDRPDIVQPRTLKRRELISRLAEISIRPIAGDSQEAFESAVVLAGLEPPTAIWHFSDHSLELAAAENIRKLPEGVVLREKNLALPEVVNPAITSFQIRPIPLQYGQYDAYVQVALNEAAPGPFSTKLTVNVGGMPIQFREVDLKPGERTGFTFKIEGARGQILRISLSSDRDDFALDNQVMIPLPEPQPLLAAWIRPDESEDPFTRLALSAVQNDGNLELLKGTPDAWPLGEPVDALIFDGWLPEEWPEDVPVIAINPPISSGPISARPLESPIPYESVRVGTEDHPVLFRVSSGRVAVTQTTVFQAKGSLEPLWIAGNEPVLAAGEYRGQRIVVIGFSPSLSEQLPFTAAFPLLMGNALFWCIEGDGKSAVRMQQLSTGDFARVRGESITWTEWDGLETRKRQYPLDSEFMELDRIGIWETDGGSRGTSHLLSARESNLRANPGDPEDDTYFAQSAGIAGSLKQWLLGLIALILILESFLFHRFSVY